MFSTPSRRFGDRSSRLLGVVLPALFAFSSTGLPQDLDGDSIAVIERGTPTVDGWDIAEFPFKVITAPLYLLALGGEWAANAAQQAHLLPWAYYLNSELNQRSLYPTVASLGSGSGTGAALLIGIPGRPTSPWGYVRGGATFKGYWRITARAGYGLEAVAPGGAHAFGTHAFGWIEDRPEDEYYGIGNDSQEDDRSNYQLKRATVGATLGFAATRDIAITIDLDWSRSEAGPGKNPTLPSVDSIFGPVEIPGFGDLDRYLSFGGSAEWRNGYRGLLPGGRWLRLGLSWNESYSDGAADFAQIEAAAGADIPFDHERRSLTLALLYQTVRPSGAGEISFYRLPTLGGSSTLPAYRTGRFRDRDLILGRAEYSYRIWLNPTYTSALVASIFLYGGMVAEDLWDEFAFDQLWPSYGIALATRSTGGSGARLEFAGGKEGLRVNFTFLVGF
jgi:hypothetical protein